LRPLSHRITRERREVSKNGESTRGGKLERDPSGKAGRKKKESWKLGYPELYF